MSHLGSVTAASDVTAVALAQKQQQDWQMHHSQAAAAGTESAGSFGLHDAF